MLDLSTAKLVGESRFRKCYEHPNNVDCVIKVQHLSGADNNCIDSPHNRELEFHSKITGCLDYFPTLVGMEETNFGQGLVFKKISSVDGSEPIHLFDKYRDKKIPRFLILQIKNIMNQLEKDALLTCAVNPENLLIIKTSDGEKLISCDTKVITIKEWLPLSKVRFFRLLKVKRRNKRLFALYNKNVLD
ncbi:YrbL family protein [Nitrincola sp.]|uniref:YrbL family protein n=1 Tax=Nitrincola sp. TaxID=1926584 RepID=UPI003A93CF18